MKTLQIPSPLHHLKPGEEQQETNTWIKRDDLIHHQISGNKWRKLVYPLQEIMLQGAAGIITFGGAFSNHIVATSIACQSLNVTCVGIIRGEEAVSMSNPSLSVAHRAGMSLHFVDRNSYRLKENAPAVSRIMDQYPGYAVIDEGGRHVLALRGVGEIISEITSTLERQPEYILTAVGTGTTFAGMSESYTGELIGINVLKHTGIEHEIKELLGKDRLPKDHRVWHDFHFGGYAKYSEELITFMHILYQNTGIKTDVIYTAKLFYAYQELNRSGYFSPGSSIVIYHSGGIQGNAGMNYRFPGLIRF